MDQLTTLELSLTELRAVIAALDPAEMDRVTNCAPWTVRQLASHTLNSQLLWAGVVTGQTLVALEDTMAAVPIEGDLAPVADDVAARTLGLWRRDGVIDAVHATPFGDLPGTVVVNFPMMDAIVHTWDLSTSVGRGADFAPTTIPAFAAVVDATCTDDIRALGLIQPATDPPADATATERLMALAGRAIPR
jgi:uncharacterized protein (TIGR03086 family)